MGSGDLLQVGGIGTAGSTDTGQVGRYLGGDPGIWENGRQMGMGGGGSRWVVWDLGEVEQGLGQQRAFARAVWAGGGEYIKEIGRRSWGDRGV